MSPSYDLEQLSSSCYSRHYSLEIVQHPLRARMCGFGDKVDLVIRPVKVDLQRGTI